MRIAVVLTGGLHPSGREQVVPVYLQLLAELARRHDVQAFVLRHLPAPAKYQLRGIGVHDLGRPWAPAGLGRAAQWRALRRAMRGHRPFDVVHGLWGDPGGWLAAIAGRASGLPSLVTCATGEFVALPQIDYGLQLTWSGRLVMYGVQRAATRLHVCTHYAADLAVRVGVTPRPDVIPLGIQAAALANPVERAGGPPWRLLQVASLNRVKDQARLVEALSVLTKTVDAHLDLVGEDTLGGALQARARALGVADRVTFHGFLDQDALVPLRRRAHLYVQTSLHEGAGVSVLEAAAAGVPIVGTRVGYVADWAPGAAEALDDPAPGALAGAIARLLDAPDRRRALAERAQAFATAHDVRWSAAALEETYASLLRR